MDVVTLALAKNFLKKLLVNAKETDPWFLAKFLKGRNIEYLGSQRTDNRDTQIKLGWNDYSDNDKNYTSYVTIPHPNSAYEDWKEVIEDDTKTFEDFMEVLAPDYGDKYVMLDQNPYQHYDKETGEPTEIKRQIETAKNSQIMYINDAGKVDTSQITTMYANFMWNVEQDTEDDVNNIAWGYMQNKTGRVEVAAYEGAGGEGGSVVFGDNKITNMTVGALPSGTDISRKNVLTVLEDILIKKQTPTCKITQTTGDLNGIFKLAEYTNPPVEADKIEYKLKYEVMNPVFSTKPTTSIKITRCKVDYLGKEITSSWETLASYNAAEVAALTDESGTTTIASLATEEIDPNWKESIADTEWGYKYKLEARSDNGDAQPAMKSMRVVVPSYVETMDNEQLIGSAETEFTGTHDEKIQLGYAYWAEYGDTEAYAKQGEGYNPSTQFEKSTTTMNPDYYGFTFYTWVTKDLINAYGNTYKFMLK